jgi:hypothetical protein
MSIKFVKLNKDWNAEPNAPEEKVYVEGSDLVLEFTVNPWAYEGFNEEERARLIFKACSKYRIGPTNDEGWYRGQCRFGKLAPGWGEFYLVKGSSASIVEAIDWVELSKKKSENHYLFYLRDCTFECEADDYQFQRTSS